MISSILNDPKKLTIILTLGLAATVLSALGFEHIGGYIPCALCLEQRIPYYVGAPIGLVAVIALYINAPSMISRLLVLGVTGLMVWSLYLGIYHSGVEWAWWQGPTDCGAAAGNITTTNANDLMAQLQATHAPSCDKASLRVLGLSFAGWNAIASVIWLYLAFRTFSLIGKKG